MRILTFLLSAGLVATSAMAQDAARPATAARPVDPVQPNPAAAPVHPVSSAGATERGMAPVQPAPGVTRRVEEAGNHDVDAQGHTLDPHGKPVGQSPAPTSSR
ncbi:MAG: hypothetical protein GAK28_00794 [Luteibacter sp.]|uniref:hypothetical protein n=1 Tax=Luteibacter sp. TaxID=1886636 RepID=UPI0013825945|nr:hypothetical protein [Luteibacter sp.]KAF1009161.1 MAG: hypothetical protein GAK28_00794 [Luteibacter sp.]